MYENTVTRFALKIFEIYLVIEINDIWPFGPSQGPQGVGNKTIVPLHVPFMWVTHTPNLVEFRREKMTPGFIFRLWEDKQSLV